MGNGIGGFMGGQQPQQVQQVRTSRNAGTHISSQLAGHKSSLHISAKWLFDGGLSPIIVCHETSIAVLCGGPHLF